jgi:hypothetical protein
MARPLGLRIASAQSVQASLFGEPVEPVGTGLGIVFEQLLPLQFGDLGQQAVAIGPAFVGVGQVAKRRARKQVGGSQQVV